MARKRMGRRRYAGRLRAAGRRAKGMFSKPTRFLGFKKDGFHVSDALIAGGLIVPAFMRVNSSIPSAVGILRGEGTYGTQPWNDRMMNALNAYCINTLGVETNGKPLTGATNPGIGGIAVGSGLVLKFVGNSFANRMMKGSAVKL